jgi:hypothetical protein
MQWCLDLLADIRQYHLLLVVFYALSNSSIDLFIGIVCGCLFPQLSEGWSLRTTQAYKLLTMRDKTNACIHAHV